MNLSIIDKKLIDSYAVLVLADIYTTDEISSEGNDKHLVPNEYREQVEIKVAERTIQALRGDNNELQG